MNNDTIQEVDVTKVIQVQGMDAIPIRDIVKMEEGGNKLVKQVADLGSKEIGKQGVCDVLNLGIGKLKKVLRLIEFARKESTKPLREAKAAVDAQIRKVTDPIDEAVSAAACQVRIWDKKLEDEQREAEDKAQKEANRRKAISEAQGGDGTNIKPVDKPLPAKLQQSTTYRDNWTFEITDKAKVPETYKVVDNTLVRNAMRSAEKGEKKEPKITIPGIRIYNEPVRVN